MNISHYTLGTIPGLTPMPSQVLELIESHLALSNDLSQQNNCRKYKVAIHTALNLLQKALICYGDSLPQNQEV